jgi:uncharacterized 2Fe-2S/4Fe-4S cluster protein (DUF4445 family)
MVRRMEKIETAIEPRFQEHFVDAMAIPHASAPYPNLTSVVDMPGRSERAASHRPKAARRRRRRA